LTFEFENASCEGQDTSKLVHCTLYVIVYISSQKVPSENHRPLVNNAVTLVSRCWSL